MTVENLRIERGIELRKIRKSKGVTQGDISKLCGVSIPTIIRIERGKSNYGVDLELRFRSALSELPDRIVHKTK